MYWLLWIFWNPLKALDLLDCKGKPDHAKVMGFVGFVLMYVLIFLNKLPPLGHLVAMLAVIFGWVGFRAFLGSRSNRGPDDK